MACTSAVVRDEEVLCDLDLSLTAFLFPSEFTWISCLEQKALSQFFPHCLWHSIKQTFHGGSKCCHSSCRDLSGPENLLGTSSPGTCDEWVGKWDRASLLESFKKCCRVWGALGDLTYGRVFQFFKILLWGGSASLASPPTAHPWFTHPTLIQRWQCLDPSHQPRGAIICPD